MRSLAVLLAVAALGLVAPVAAAADAAAPCRPLPRGPEGPIDPTRTLPGTGTLRAAMIFVDFPDAVASEDAASLAATLTPGAGFLEQLSGGRLHVPVTVHPTWYRMPAPTGSYSTATFDAHRTLMADAIAAADADIDFSRYRIVYVVLADTMAFPITPAFVAWPGFGIAVDGTDIRNGATFGHDVRTPLPGYGAHVLSHETLHSLGLPDLYDYTGVGSDYYAGLRFAGGWDIMSWVTPVVGVVAWHRHLLGWLRPGQLACVPPGRSATRILRPSGSRLGTVALGARVGASAVIAEVRRPVGVDAGVCSTGVLVTLVRSVAPRPVTVRTPHPGGDPAAIGRCGPRYDAPLRPGEQVRVGRTTVRVLARVGTGYRVRVTVRGG